MSPRPRCLCGMALLVIALLTLVAPARAQTASPAPPASPSVDALQQLADTIQDPAQRQKLLDAINTMIAVEHAQGEQPAPATPEAFFDALSAQIDTITNEILTAAQIIVDAPRLVHWVEMQAADRAARDFWLAVGIRLATIFGTGIIAELVMRLLLRQPMRKLATRNGDAVWTRLLLMLLSLVLEALPLIVFAAAASFTVPFTHPHYGTRQVARVLIAAILWARLALAVAHVVLLAPAASTLYPLGDETRNYLYIWARRFTNWAVYGFALAAAAWWLSVPGAIYALLLRGTSLVLAILAIIFVLQNRRVVGDWIRGTNATGGWRLIRHRLADIWHVLAIMYVAGTFGVYVLNISGGYFFLARATVLTIVVLLAAGVCVRIIERLSRRGFAISPEMKVRYPTLETRANRYLPVLYYGTAVFIYFFAALTLLQAWGINAFAWLGTDAGRRATGAVVTIGIVVVLALFSWELFSSAIERYLNASDGDGRPLSRSARARTLLPLLRTTVLVVMIVIVGLIVLSQIGVNIAPLLAGAGVVGLAVGFGSQALVKDVITGLFILIEDTLAVGEVVDVGKGSGIVESISIRTIRLRDMSGTLQTIPFSEITTIKNMTREYAYAVFNVGVVYREDPDHAIAVLRGVAEEMAADPAWAPLLLAPIEIVGLDRFTDSAQVISLRLKTPPLQQWAVQREFNRRMKKAFDANGIEMPAMNQTPYLMQPQQRA